MESKKLWKMYLNGQRWKIRQKYMRTQLNITKKVRVCQMKILVQEGVEGLLEASVGGRLKNTCLIIVWKIKWNDQGLPIFITNVFVVLSKDEGGEKRMFCPFAHQLNDLKSIYGELFPNVNKQQSCTRQLFTLADIIDHCNNCVRNGKNSFGHQTLLFFWHPFGHALKSTKQNLMWVVMTYLCIVSKEAKSTYK